MLRISDNVQYFLFFQKIYTEHINTSKENACCRFELVKNDDMVDSIVATLMVQAVENDPRGIEVYVEHFTKDADVGTGISPEVGAIITQHRIRIRCYSHLHT